MLSPSRSLSAIPSMVGNPARLQHLDMYTASISPRTSPCLWHFDYLRLLWFGEYSMQALEYMPSMHIKVNACPTWAAQVDFLGLEHPGVGCMSMQCTLSLAYGIVMAQAKQRIYQLGR